MLLTVCTLRQLPYALALGESWHRHHPGATFQIGLADDPAQLPANWSSPYPILTLADAGLSATVVAELSARYTPSQFTAAVKPAFVRAARQTAQPLLYADPETFFFQPLSDWLTALRNQTLRLTPLLTRPVGEVSPPGTWPDEKAFQTTGLFGAGLLGFGIDAETNRLLAWWQDRAQSRANENGCEGLCLDQRWLMHAPALFRNVVIDKDPALQAALWNLPEKELTLRQGQWYVANDAPLRTANFRGLINDDGLFFGQNRVVITQRPDVRELTAYYAEALKNHQYPALLSTRPAYGRLPEPARLRGWRLALANGLRSTIQFINTVPLPART